MQISCQECQAQFELLQEKLPQGREIWLVCPSCHAPFQWGPPQDSQTGDPIAAQTDPNSEANSPFAASSDLLPVEVVAEGVETALICATHPQQAQTVEQALKDMGYYVSLAQSAKAALIKLRNNDYNVFVLDETFEGQKQEKEILLQFVQQMPIHARRQCFFCILSEDQRTLDHMAAFSNCANLVVNIQDLDKTKVILQKAIQENKNFYKVLFQESKEMQKF
jgi:hypothetical protein